MTTTNTATMRCQTAARAELLANEVHRRGCTAELGDDNTVTATGRDAYDVITEAEAHILNLAAWGVPSQRQYGQPVGYTAHCKTCSVHINDQWGEHEPPAGWTHDDTLRWAGQHICIADVRITQPGGAA